MSRIKDDVLLEAGRIGLIGLFLLAIVVLVPDAGASAGKSFFSVAFESSWRSPGDLAAAWCSLKILLLSGSLIMLTDSLSKVMEAFRREALAVTASFAALVPFLGLPLGVYELIKALL